MSIVCDSHLNMFKAHILNGVDPDAKNAIAAINEQIEYLEAQIYTMQRYAKFAKLTGETYTIPANVAAWLDLATEHEELYGQREALQYVNVREYAGRTWLAATDGYRLHAYAVNLSVGVYLMVDNKLRQVESHFPDWTTIIPKAPTIIAVDEYAVVDSYAAWNFLNGNLVKLDPKRPYKLNENYRLKQRYFKDALSLGDAPSFALSEVTKKQPEPYQRKMMIAWPDAFALLMPALPER